LHKHYIAEAVPGRVFAQGADRVRRLSFALGMGMNLSWDEALDVFRGIIANVSNSVVEFEWEEWRKCRMV
jgi:hypothetical protein